MTAATTSIVLTEWEEIGPNDRAELKDRLLDPSPATRSVVERLARGGLLELTELRRGLQVKAYSHVGRVRVGDLIITIEPKIKGASLLGLVRYAYELRRLNLVSDLGQLVDDRGFEDLLISQLNAEVRELVSRGLSRAYLAIYERLSSPRGRIDLPRIALDGGAIMATLPCRHAPRVEDTLLNRVLAAGLRLAGSMAGSLDLRRESRSLACLMEERVSTVRLDGAVLDQADKRMNRLTTAYAPSISIIHLLFDAQGVTLDGQTTTTTLPGFLFDMNAFFQALLSRFIRENLPGCSVRDEQGLRGMICYDPGFNPHRRQAPTPRPDFVVRQRGTAPVILDAKYRDLWERALPREMLYQLVVYAMSQRENPRSTILYPTTDPRATEARINVSDPLLGGRLGEVCLRPVHLQTLASMIQGHGSKARGARECYARRLVFGE